MVVPKKWARPRHRRKLLLEAIVKNEALIAKFTSHAAAKAAALGMVASGKKSPIVRRHGAMWGLFEPAVSTTQLKKILPPVEKLGSAGDEGGSWYAAQENRATLHTGEPAHPPLIIKLNYDKTSDSSAEASAGINQRSTRASTDRSRPSGFWSMSPREARTMAEELRHSFRGLPKEVAAEWVKRTLQRFGIVVSRRVKNLIGLTIRLTEALGEEVLILLRAALEGRIPSHVLRRLGHGSERAAEFCKSVSVNVSPLVTELKNDPARVAPDLLVAALAFYVSSGGFDGDGGIADQDISLLGIEAHRSIFTHSIAAGAVVETALWSLVDFVAIGHRYLPKGHDTRWTVIKERFERTAVAGASGVSAGLAYHLGVDGLVQPGAYHDLPFEMSIEGHQTILTANAVAEALDINEKNVSSRAAAEKKGKISVDRVIVGVGAIALTLLGLG